MLVERPKIGACMLFSVLAMSAPLTAAAPVASAEVNQGSAAPEDKQSAGPFARNRIRVGGNVGWASSFGGGESVSWFVAGAGAGYFLLPGLELHTDVTAWIGEPFIFTLTPGIRYVFHQVSSVKPYVGVLYRHYFLSAGLPDTDSVGGRAGVYFPITRNTYLGGGVMVEQFLSDDVFRETTQIYPELTVSVSF